MRPVGQAAKTSPSHGENGGSIPPRVTKASKAKPQSIALGLYFLPFTSSLLPITSSLSPPLAFEALEVISEYKIKKDEVLATPSTENSADRRAISSKISIARVLEKVNNSEL